MSYPPPPPPGPPPAGPPAGPPAWRPPAGPPGWGPPGGPPGGPHGPGPYGAGGGPKRNVGLVVGLVALVVLLVAGISTTAILLATGDDDGDERAGGASTSATTSAATDTATASAPETAVSPASPSTTTPPTPYVPSDDTGDDIHGDVAAADFPGDWNFKFGEVEHRATLRDSWDHASCGPVEARAVLTQQRCQYAVQWSYSALGGKVRMTHVFLVFDDERHAKAAEAKLQDEDLDLPAGSLFDDFVQGKWNKSVHGNIVGVTVATARTTVPEKKLQGLVNYMNTDYRLALLWKGF